MLFAQVNAFTTSCFSYCYASICAGVKKYTFVFIMVVIKN